MIKSTVIRFLRIFYFRLEMVINRLTSDFFLSSSLSSLLDVERSLDDEEKVFDRCCVVRTMEVSEEVEGRYDLIIVWALG